jgi:HK97 family phage prohead protease
MNRAYSLVEIKRLDEGKRTFSGWATTPEVDRVQDVINPLGAAFKNPLPLLHAHKHDAPIGSVRLKKPTKNGIEFEADIPVIEEPGPLKDRVDTAWGEIKHGLVRAVSIGFKPVKYAYREEGGIDFQEVEIFELSTVSIPANASAVITTVKSIDAALRAAAGVPEPTIYAPHIDGRGADAAAVDRIKADLGLLNAHMRECNQALIARKTEILSDAPPAATGKSVRVVRLNEPARDRAKPPFVIRKIR